MLRGCSWLLILAASGCGFEAVHVLTAGDLGGAGLSRTPVADLAGVDLAGVDLAETHPLDLAGVDLAGADLGSSKPSPCPLPALLVAVENSSSGQIARMQIGDGSSLPKSCSTLSGQGLIQAQPFSLAPVGSLIALQGIDALQLVDPSSDTIVWSIDAGSTDFPLDVFSLNHPDGRVLVGVAWASTGMSTSAVARMEAWSQAGTMVESWDTNSAQLPLGLGIYGVTSNPKTPTHFLALDPDNTQMAWDVDPWSVSKTGLFSLVSGNPMTIYADIWSTEMRLVWVSTTAPTAVIYNNDSGASGLFGPIACTGCTLVHAVPDPSDNLRFFGLCDGPGQGTRRVVRFDSAGGSCDTVLEGASFGGQSQLTRLAISQ